MSSSNENKIIVPYREPGAIEETGLLKLFNTLYEKEKSDDFKEILKFQIRNEKMLKNKTKKIIKKCLDAPKGAWVPFPLWFRLSKSQYQTLSEYEISLLIYKQILKPWFADLGEKIMYKPDTRVEIKYLSIFGWKTYWFFWKMEFILTEKKAK